MKRVYWIIISFLVFCLLGIAILYYLKKETPIDYATGYDDLTVYIKQSNTTDKIKIWKSEDGVYYFFLPSYVNEKSRVSIGNLHEKDSIFLDNTILTSGDNLISKVEMGKMYDLSLQLNGVVYPKENIIFLKSENIATIYLETESGDIEAIHADKEIKEKSSLRILDASGRVSYDKKIEYLKSRGNSTYWAYDKKAYQMKLYNKEGLLGLDKAKKWLLLANYVDNSLIRNRLVFHFANQYTHIPATQCVPVDLYVNGEYMGNYNLCEKPEVGENRLDITDLEELNEALNSKDNLVNSPQYVSEDGNIRAVDGLVSPENITGGYLVELIQEDKYAVARSAFRTSKGKCFEVVSPENATIEEVEYISGLFQEIEATIDSEDGVNPYTGKHFREYIDVTSWGTRYLIEELFHNPDATYASYFFYKKADDPLIYAGPLWDYDRTLGNYAGGDNIYYIDQPQGIEYYGAYSAELMKHEEFSDYVITQFREIMCPYVENQMRQDVTSWEKELKASAEMNKVRWPGTRDYYDSHEASVDYIISFMEKRLEYCKEVWLADELYHTVTFLDYYGGVANKYIVKHGEYIQAPPKLTAYVAIFNGWKSVETGKFFDSRRPILEDVVYQSQWIDISLLLANGLSVDNIDVQNIDVEALEALIKCIKEQQEVESDE